MNLNIEVTGAGFPILCLHGHPGNSRCMSVFTERLSQGFQTLAPDFAEDMARVALRETLK